MNAFGKILIVLLAVSSFRTDAFTSDRNRGGYFNDLGFNYLQGGNLWEAENCFRRAIEAEPGNKYYHNNIAVVYLREKQYGKAYASLRNAVAIDADYVRGLINISICCFYLGKYSEAYTYYRRGVEIDPEYVKSRFQYNRILDLVEKRQSEVPHDRTVGLLLHYLKEHKSTLCR